MKQRVFALRHGERADRAPSQRPCPLAFDPCLTEKGLLQAEESAARIVSMIPPNSTVHLVSSPFFRCLETSSKISRLLNIPIHVEYGFSEFLFSFDFSFDPQDFLHFRTNPEISNEISAEIIENNHLTASKFPETSEEGQERIKHNWGKYIETRKEDVIIVVSHLYVVWTLTKLWMGEDCEIDDRKYCMLTVADYDGQYNMIQVNDNSHVVTL